MTALCPTGLGGGSLVYQGMSLEPTKEIFNTHFPVDLDWDTMHRVHYPRVATMLQLETCPDDIHRVPQLQGRPRLRPALPGRRSRCREDPDAHRLGLRAPRTTW